MKWLLSPEASPRGYSLDDVDIEAIKFGLRTYSALIDYGYAEEFDQNDDVARTTRELSDRLVRDFERGKRMLGYERFNLLTELCFQPVYDAFIMTERPMHDRYARLTYTTTEEALRHISAIGSLIHFEGFDIEFVHES
jgi:hypothetical protein